jgi:hypothetical protein
MLLPKQARLDWTTACAAGPCDEDQAAAATAACKTTYAMHVWTSPPSMPSTSNNANRCVRLCTNGAAVHSHTAVTAAADHDVPFNMK